LPAKANECSQSPLNEKVMSKLSPTAKVLAKRWMNMSMKALALYFSSGLVGT